MNVKYLIENWMKSQEIVSSPSLKGRKNYSSFYLLGLNVSLKRYGIIEDPAQQSASKMSLGSTPDIQALCHLLPSSHLANKLGSGFLTHRNYE